VVATLGPLAAPRRTRPGRPAATREAGRTCVESADFANRESARAAVPERAGTKADRRNRSGNRFRSVGGAAVADGDAFRAQVVAWNADNMVGAEARVRFETNRRTRSSKTGAPTRHTHDIGEGTRMEIDSIGGFSLVPPGKPGKRGDVDKGKASGASKPGDGAAASTGFRSSTSLARLKSVAASTRPVLDGRPDAIAAARARLRDGSLETPRALREAAARILDDRRS
jgi:hypothetical protein